MVKIVNCMCTSSDKMIAIKESKGLLPQARGYCGCIVSLILSEFVFPLYIRRLLVFNLLMLYLQLC